MKRLILFTFILFFVYGCAHVVSKDLRDLSEKNVPVPLLFRDHDAYKGRIFILGGTIVNLTNTDQGTFIEVVEKPLDNRGRPQYTDLSRGRFLVLYEGHLDTTIFSQGRQVTVAGEVLGSKTRSLGDSNYSYLFVKSRGLYLIRPGYDIPIQIGIGISHSF
jgi:outer membrane lipoprotein